jgi:two-component system OmpR family response regulator/two-component system response regulator QseB
MRVLLVEDDLELGAATKKGLAQLGLVVDWLTSGAHVLRALQDHPYACLVLDLGLPQVSGVQCINWLRQGGSSLPVVVVTARGEKQTRIELLDMGADDYVTKPYDLDELAARLRAVTRRSAAGEPVSARALISYGPIRLCGATRTVTLNGRDLELTSKEFGVLETLMRNQGRIVTRSALQEALYGWGEELSSNAIEVFIYQLRRKLGVRMVKTVRGIGYRLATEPELRAMGEPA